MKFDKLTMDLIIRYIYERWPYPRKCQLCGNLTWNVNDRPMELRECMGGVMVIGGDTQYMPVIVITCGNCGNSIFLNGFATGIMKQVNPPPNINLPEEPEGSEGPEGPEGSEGPEEPEQPQGPVIN